MTRVVVALLLSVAACSSSSSAGPAPSPSTEGGAGSGGSVGAGGASGASGASAGGEGGGAGGSGEGGTSAEGGASGEGGTAGGAGAGAGAGGAAMSDTWSNWAMGFFATYCVECHGPTDAKRDYSTMNDVVRDHVTIRCGVASTKLADCTASFPPPKQFPITDAAGTNPKPTDAERDRLVAWIDAGMMP